MYNTPAYKTARVLGWFSLALGAAEIIAPGAVNRSLGFREHNALVRGFGLREIAAGLGILIMPNPTPWVWARVTGDMLDLTSLLFGLDRNNPRRSSAMAAFVSVAAVTLIDYICARNLTSQVEYRQLPRRDYSDRSGLGEKLSEVRKMSRS
jgi:hypothetical protein